jgi:hypothetical protein
MYDNQRAYFRILYPLEERPELVVGEHTTEVVEVAEGGISFLVRPLGVVEVEQRLAGTLRLGARWTRQVEGEVVWVKAGRAAIKLDDPIPFKVILGEQLRLRGRYPWP